MDLNFCSIKGFFVAIGNGLYLLIQAYRISNLKLASFKEDQRPNRCNAASHVGAAVLAHVARSGRLDAALRERSK